MEWLRQLFKGPPELADTEKSRLAEWKALHAPALDTPITESRYVVVDVETSGLNLVKDRLIAIGAVAVNGGRVDLADSLEVVLRQDVASNKENILIHGIGGTAQTEGLPAEEALLGFLEFLGTSPLVAFHVTFDETMIRKAMKAHLGFRFEHPWVDLAYVAPALYPDLGVRYRALDDWTGHFRIGNYARHSALADALSTAQLLQVLSRRLGARKASTFKRMRDLDKAQRMTQWRM